MLNHRPVIIAHRGASGYLPEHTFPAKALAHAQGADYLEQDLVLTRDSVPIVLHDIHLDTVTDVAQQFVGRQRDDGRYYAIDFDLEEIKKLHVSERFHHLTGQAVFSQRFPAHRSAFFIPTLEEELEFIQGLNHSTGRSVGIYPELKQPAFHHQHGQDIAAVVLPVLQKFGYRTHDSNCFLQCFDLGTLQRLRNELQCELKQVYLLEAVDAISLLGDEQHWKTFCDSNQGVVDGLGPDLNSFLQGRNANDALHEAQGMVAKGHSQKLCFHPWTCRKDLLPKGVENFQELHHFLKTIGVDGVFTDFPDLSRQLFESVG